jgi:hypothetical protein
MPDTPAPPIGSPVSRRAALIAVAIMGAVVLGYGTEWALSVRPDRPFGHTPAGTAMGWIGFAVTLLVFGYSVRKRWSRKRDWPKRWFLLHQAAGTVGPILLLVHSGTHLHALVPVLALAALWLIVVTGYIGQAVHYAALQTLHARRQYWLDAGLDEREADARVAADETIEHRLRWWQYAHAPLTLVFLVLAVLHIGGVWYFGRG